MLSIQTNVNSLIAQQNLNVNNAFQSKTIEQLTSGYRINQSGDDAAGLAVANGYRNSISELTQGVGNGNDAAAQLQIMDGGMSNISQILDRLKTLAVQSASGSFTGTRTTLNTEFQTDLNEINRQAQSIGLNTGGVFANNMAVYLGAGSGSQSQINSQVNVNLTQSAVDSQALGLSGMQVVNTDASTGKVLADLGSTSPTSVEDIVNNTSGTNANQEALAGYASFQFSGAGFSDAGKVNVSVNLTGVSDVATLATAVNQAIQAAGTGSAAASAFKNAGITASVYTDADGKQALAFSSSTSAFQVQAGDQMANALMGNVNVVGNVAQGTAVNSTAVTGAITTSGNFGSPQNVHLTITGGGLASAQTLTLNSSVSSTSSAIANLVNQFQSNTALVQAGLTMSNSAGGSALGGKLSFTSATGQAFNVQVTGDTANLLGLGSFLSSGTGTATYSNITAGAAYSATAVTGVLGLTQGQSAGLEISLNGGSATALTPIDLTAGAHASVASLVGTGAVNPGAVDIQTGSNSLNITVVNNGIATTATNITLGTNQTATSGSVVSSTIGTNSSIAVTAANNTFSISVNGGNAINVTVATNNSYNSTTLAAAINTAFGQTTDSTTGAKLSTEVTAGTNAAGMLTISSKAVGAGSSVTLSAGTGTTPAPAILMATTGSNTPVTITTGSNDVFNVTVGTGQAIAVTIGSGTYNTASDLAGAIETALQSTVDTSTGAGNADLSTEVSATTNAGGFLVLVSTGTGPNAFVGVSSNGTNGGLAATSLTDGQHASGLTFTDDMSGTLNLSSVNGQGTADAPQTLASIATTIQTALGASNATVSVTNSGELSIASVAKGANSTVVINGGTALSALGLGTTSSTLGQNSSIGDIVSNLNAQFAASTAFQAAGLTASATDSNGHNTGSFITINSSNGTQFRLNALGSGSAAAENIGFGTAGMTIATNQTTAAKVLSSSITQSSSVTVDGTHNTLQIAVNGVSSGNPVAISIVSNGTYTGGTGAGSLVAALNTAIGNSALSGHVTAGWDAATGDLTFTGASGSSATIAVTSGSSNDLLSRLGITSGASGVGTTTAAVNPTGGSDMSTLQAYGTSTTGTQVFNALQYGNEKQVLTFSATTSTGAMETKSITLQNNSLDQSGSSLDNAIAAINQQLQASTTNPALQSIVAVKENTGGGAEGINFISSLTGFTVGVGGTGSSDGVSAGAPGTLTSGANGSAANVSISTQTGAEAAVTAITTAVAKLGSAQAAVGIGENQLNFAINLAQSQITNFSAAESQIRDADIAQQAANLSKAQVLQQSSIAAMAQANSAPQAVLSLLKG